MNFPKKCIFRKSYFHHSEPRHGPVAQHGAASLAVLLQHGPGPEHEAVLVAHLAAALVTHAASLPANVQTAGASEVNLGSSRSLTSEVKKQPPRSN